MTMSPNNTGLYFTTVVYLVELNLLIENWM